MISHSDAGSSGTMDWTMGVTVRQKKKGRGEAWWVFIRTNNKLRSKKIGDRRAAEAVASELRKQMKAGELNLPAAKPADASPTFGEFTDRYINDYAKVALKRSTWKSYEQMLRTHILPVLRDQPIDQITRSTLKRFLLAKRNEGLARGTLQNIQVLLSGIFSHAYEDEVIKTHPALKLGKFLGKHDRREHVNPLTADQVRQFLAICRAQFREHHAFMLTAFRTGMRLGELIGLGWDDIDFDAMRIEVKRGCSHGHFSTPKSHKSRVVDMSDQLAQTLIEHRHALLAKFGALPTVEPQISGSKTEHVRLVFPGPTGGTLDPDNFRKRVFTKILEAADLPHMRIHDIRHTYASMLLQNGESLHYVKEQLGHASIQTTVDVYGHIVPGSNRKAVNRLDDPAPDPEPPALRLSGQAG